MSEKRKLTPFLAHEMLFDFATKQLDPSREAAIKEFIREDGESQSLLEAIRHGIAYAESLKNISLTEEALQDLDQSENFVSLSKRLARWSEWPDSLRWSIIAVAISICTAGLVVVIPWKTIPIFRTGPSFDSGSIEMARVEPRQPVDDESTVAANTGEDSKETETGPFEGSGDEEFSEEASGAVPPTTVAAGSVRPTPAASSWVPTVPAVSPATSPSIPPSTPMARVAVPTPVPPPPIASSAETAPPTASSKASRSFVYRAFMTLNDLENIAPKITQQMKELGAEKAGEVELGWRRGTGRYYHFSMPEANEQKLLEALRVYGPVRISKDPHPRVMPEGQVRFILWIESGS